MVDSIRKWFSQEASTEVQISSDRNVYANFILDNILWLIVIVKSECSIQHQSQFTSTSYQSCIFKRILNRKELEFSGLRVCYILLVLKFRNDIHIMEIVNFFTCYWLFTIRVKFFSPSVNFLKIDRFFRKVWKLWKLPPQMCFLPLSLFGVVEKCMTNK